MDAERYPTTVFGEARRTLGRFGYVAYFPAPLPRTVELSRDCVLLLADAEAALGRLVGAGALVPNHHLLIRPYVIREAIASSRIEGTQASMRELFELDATGAVPTPDVEEVVNYVQALEWGMRRLPELPISTRLVCEMHERLLAGVRGRERSPGQLRKGQNWIGSPGSTLEAAQFVPPPADELSRLLTDWERFANEPVTMPVLVQCALLHYQFETIHPFLDGNGRLGRLLMVFFLVARGRLQVPLLYLSSYLDQHRSEYYEALQAPRESGDLTPWLVLFLRAVETQATDAVSRAERVIAIRERYRAQAARLRSPNALPLADLVSQLPIVIPRLVEERLGVSRPTALSLLRRFEELGIVVAEQTGARGGLRFVAPEIFDALGGREEWAPSTAGS